MSGDSIDIDAQPPAVELLATVVLEGTLLRLVPEDPARWLAVLARHRDQRVRVAISRMWRKRSNPQNRYAWGVMYPTLLEGFRQIAADAGEACPFRTKEDVHAAMKHRFIGLSVLRLPGGEEIETPASTTVLTTVQFSAYCEAIWRWAAERYSIYIPAPNERVEA